MVGSAAVHHDLAHVGVDDDRLAVGQHEGRHVLVHAVDRLRQRLRGQRGHEDAHQLAVAEGGLQVQQHRRARDHADEGPDPARAVAAPRRIDDLRGEKGALARLDDFVQPVALPAPERPLHLQEADARDVGLPRQHAQHEAPETLLVRRVDAARPHGARHRRHLQRDRVERAAQLVLQPVQHGVGGALQQAAGVVPRPDVAGRHHRNEHEQHDRAERQRQQRAHRDQEGGAVAASLQAAGSCGARAGARRPAGCVASQRPIKSALRRFATSGRRRSLRGGRATS